VVADSDRVLDHAITETDRFVEDVRLEVIACEPGLMEIDCRILQDRGLEDPEASSSVRTDDE